MTQTRTGDVIDVSPLVPEARRVAREVAQVYVEHTRPWFLAFLIHGSALKGDIIPECSDIDFHLYLTESPFDEDGHLPLSLAANIHRDLSKIDVTPFSYIQCYAFPVGPAGGGRADWVGPIAGSYHMLLGELPVPEATADEVCDTARRRLAMTDRDPLKVIDDLVEHGSGLERRVRLLCTDVWPTLLNILALEDPLAVWQLPKSAAIAMLPEDEPLGKEARLFYQKVRAYYVEERSLERALDIIEHGVTFLREARDWYRLFDAGHAGTPPSP